MLLLSFKRRESVKDAVRRRIGLTTLTKRDGKLAVKSAERMMRD